ncbi:MAG: hypothetical protein SGI77_11910 [Pirellulaceae bacterium]|nr:hypothetical protein [Pirellulaceae bacterium]
MSRHKFTVGRQYVGKLVRVNRRPIENDPQSKIELLRLEFEIYDRWVAERTLQGLGKIASRDIVVGGIVSATKDCGVALYANAFGLKSRQDEPAAWIKIPSGRVWILIEFGETESSDYRNPFERIQAFDRQGWKVNEFKYAFDKEWVGPEEAGDDLGYSPATIRRKTDALFEEWGEQLLRRTTGGHRIINLPLLQRIVPRAQPK